MLDFPGFRLFFKPIAFFILSFLLVHFLSFFGFFCAVAYPIFWFLVPHRLPCFFCWTRNEGGYCHFCRRPAIRAEGLNPKDFVSVLFNSLLILTLSLVSLGTVFLESRILFKLGFPPTPKTVSFTIPPGREYRLGEIFPMKIEIAGIKTPINAIQSDISFDPGRMEVVEIDTRDSFAKIFIQKEINNEVGYARLSGGLPNPGYSGPVGTFGTIYLRGKIAGLAQVHFLPSSLVLANDGRGSNILRDMAEFSFLILPEKISPEESKLQEAILKVDVLGEAKEGPQMRFYQEGEVLGEEVSFEKPNWFWALLEKVDRFILSSFASIISLI